VRKAGLAGGHLAFAGLGTDELIFNPALDDLDEVAGSPRQYHR
jgi:hypothetical protein